MLCAGVAVPLLVDGSGLIKIALGAAA